MVKNEIIFEEIQTDLFQPHVKTHRGLMVKIKKILGLSQEVSFAVITWPWVKLYVPTEESFPIPLKYIDWRYENYRHYVRCDVGETFWRLLERDGERELSDA